MKNLLIVFLLLATLPVYSQQTFTNLNDLLDYAAKKSITLQSNDIRFSQAKQAKLAAIISIFDPAVSIPAGFTNNTKLPVNLFPAETFGGQPGTFRQIQSGVQYNTSFTQNADIKLVNLAGLENLKLAKINIDLTTSNNVLSLKNLQENIATNYFNIVTLQEQLLSTQKNLAVADTLFQIATKKYEQGLVKQQDVNDTKVSYLTTAENINQIDFLIKYSYLSLKILCDIPENEEVIVKNQAVPTFNAKPVIEENGVNFKNSMLKEQYALSNYRQISKSFLPTLSLALNNAYQLYNTEFKVFDGNWINSNYIGLRLNFNLPNATLIGNQTKARFDYVLASKNTEQIKIKSALEIKQLENDYSKAFSQATANKAIFELRKDSYQKNKNLYGEGLLGLDQTLNSFNTMVNADYNLISSTISLLLAEAKIEINNKTK